MRVLVVDDSTLFRKVMRDALAVQPDVEVVGVAGDGRRALEKIEQLAPDLVTLDIEMPELDGLSVLGELRQRKSDAGVIVVSSGTSASAKQTAQALRLGAFDFVLKPSEPSLEQNIARLRAELEPKLRTFAARRGHELAEETHGSAAPGAAVSRRAPETLSPLSCRLPNVAAQIVAIGVSTGGPSALAQLLPRLPSTLPVPIVLVQHMPPVFTRSLADDLSRHCAVAVREAVDGETLRPGTVYIAPGGRQMKLASERGRTTVVITDDPPERACRPSVDYLFRSVAEVYGGSVLAVVLTGMGDDGTAGCAVLKQHGAQIAAQDRDSCVVYGMPRQVAEAGLADVVCPLDEMHDVILSAVAKGGGR
jgi:two-component system chemotaxis response regulator CheB